MLTHEQLTDFSRRGWVIQEGIFDGDFMDACRMAMDERTETQPADRKEVDPDINFGLINHQQVFRDCFLHPMMIEGCRQLMGTELRHRFTWMNIKEPHLERHTNRRALMDIDRLAWHRDMRPKWGTFVDDDDPSLANCILINCMVPVTDIGPDDGGTMVLEGSHKLEGAGISELRQCPVAQIEAPRGSVVYFPETLMHTAVPILSEKKRYVMFYAFVPPWFEVWHGGEVPKEIVESYDDMTLRRIIGGDERWGYNGQSPRGFEG